MRARASCSSSATWPALVPPYEPDAAFHATSAALEFAVRGLEVPTVIVMGHAMCGGIHALLEGPTHPVGDFLVPWMRIAEPAKRRVLACGAADPQTACEQESVKLSLANLLTFPWVAEPVRAGRLRLEGMTFDIRSGVLAVLQEDGRFARSDGWRAVGTGVGRFRGDRHLQRTGLIAPLPYRCYYAYRPGPWGAGQDNEEERPYC